MSSTEVKHPKNRAFAIMTILLGSVGLFGAWELANEYIKTLKNTDYIPNCNVSVLVTCGPNMDSWQGSLFGFSNTLLGLAAFIVPIVVGVAILAGARFASWFWLGYRAGLLLGIVFVFWLAFQSIFRIGTLCPWCMVIWSVMIPLFFFTAFKPEASNFYPVSQKRSNALSTLNSWAWVFVLASYLLIAATAQFQLNWFAEFAR